MSFLKPSIASRGLPLLAVLGVSGGLLATSPASRAADWKGFLQLGDIKGESTGKGHEGWIDVTTISEGIQAYGAGAGVGGASGAAKPMPVTVTHLVDRTSPKIALALASGTSLGNAVIDLTPVGRTTTLLLKLELGEVRVTKLRTQGVTGGPPTEELSLSFGALAANSLKILGTIKTGTPARGSSSSPIPLATGWPAPTAAGLLPGTGTTADTATPWLSRNLIRNPGAEAGAGAPADWTPVGPFTTQPYDAFPGLGGCPDHGTRLFTTENPRTTDAGDAADAAAGTQVIDLSTAAQAIDAGQLQAVLAGWLGGTTGEQEAARLMALFRDATGAHLGSLGIASAPGEPALTRLEQAGLVPAGTRSIEVTLRFQRTGHAEGRSAAYADNLSLVLEEIAAVSELPVDIQLLRASGSLERARVRLSWVPRLGGVIVESADSLGGPWRTESGPTLLDAGREHFEVPASADAPARFWRVRPASELR